MSHHEGETVIVNLTFPGKEATPAQRAYFRKVIVPEMQKAFMKNGEPYTLEKTENLIISFSPEGIEEIEVKGKYQKRVKALEELSREQVTKVIDNIKRIAAEIYGYVLPD